MWDGRTHHSAPRRLGVLPGRRTHSRFLHDRAAQTIRHFAPRAAHPEASIRPAPAPAGRTGRSMDLKDAGASISPLQRASDRGRLTGRPGFSGRSGPAPTAERIDHRGRRSGPRIRLGRCSAGLCRGLGQRPPLGVASGGTERFGYNCPGGEARAGNDAGPPVIDIEWTRHPERPLACIVLVYPRGPRGCWLASR